MGDAFGFDGGAVVTLHHDGSSEVVVGPKRPVRIDGFTVGVAHVVEPPPHRGELHPDGDELLYVISGVAEVVLDDGDHDTVGTETRHRVGPGEAFVVPRGLWHRIETVEPYHLVHVTPGPSSDHRPPA